jgi:branched-chain amino acid transport system permease protein
MSVAASDRVQQTAPARAPGEPPGRRTRALRVAAIVLGLALLLVLPTLMPNDYYRGLLVITLIYSIFGIGYDVQFGYAGLFNLGHAMFFGVGAYTAALFGQEFEITNVLVTIPAAVALGLVMALILGVISLRREGPQLAMISLGVAQLMLLVVLNEEGVTQGPIGLSVSSATLDVGVWSMTFITTTQLYFLALGMLVLSVFVVRRLLASRMGSGWLCVRENVMLARAQGVRPFRARMGALLVGAGIGSAAGALYSYNTGFLTPDVFALTMIVTALVVVIVGGSGTTYGSILGAALFVLVPEVLRGAADYRLLIFGIVLAAVMLWLPEGLWPLLGRLVKRVRRVTA